MDCNHGSTARTSARANIVSEAKSPRKIRARRRRTAYDPHKVSNKRLLDQLTERTASCTPSARHLATCIWRRARNAGGWCFESNERLMVRAGIRSHSTIVRALRALVTAGVLVREFTPGPRDRWRKRSSEYRLLVGIQLPLPGIPNPPPDLAERDREKRAPRPEAPREPIRDPAQLDLAAVRASVNDEIARMADLRALAGREASQRERELLAAADVRLAELAAKAASQRAALNACTGIQNSIPKCGGSHGSNPPKPERGFAPSRSPADAGASQRDATASEITAPLCGANAASLRSAGAEASDRTVPVRESTATPSSLVRAPLPVPDPIRTERRSANAEPTRWALVRSSEARERAERHEKFLRDRASRCAELSSAGGSLKPAESVAPNHEPDPWKSSVAAAPGGLPAPVRSSPDGKAETRDASSRAAPAERTGTGARDDRAGRTPGNDPG